jgi:hypothetical protein
MLNRIILLVPIIQAVVNLPAKQAKENDYGF